MNPSALEPLMLDHKTLPSRFMNPVVPTWGFLLRAFVVSLCLGAVAAQAQDEDDDFIDEDVIELDPFTVAADSTRGWVADTSMSAARIQLELAKTPRAISVVTAEFIEDTGAYDVIDALAFTSGVTMSPPRDDGIVRQENRATDISIRGVDAGVVFRNFYRHFGPTWNVNVDRVEVIKGPASALYGISTPGGQVNIITKRSQFRRAVEVSSTVGSFDQFRAVVDVQDQMIPDRLAYRVIAAFENDGIYYDDTPFQRWLVHIPLSLRITDNLQINVEWERQEQWGSPYKAQLRYPDINEDGLWQFEFWPDRAHTTGTDDWEYRTWDMDTFNVETLWSPFAGWDLQVNIARGEQDSYFQVTDTGPNIGTTSVFWGYRTLPNSKNVGDYRQKAFMNETYLDTWGGTAILSISQDLGDWLEARLMLGGYAYEDRFRRRSGQVSLMQSPFDGRDTAYNYLGTDITNLEGRGLLFDRFPHLFETYGDVADFFTNNIINKRSIDWDLLIDKEINDTPNGMAYYQPRAESRLENEAVWATLSTTWFDERVVVMGGIRRDYITQYADPADPGNENESDSPMFAALVNLTRGISIFGSYSESFVDQFTSLQEGATPEPVGGEGTEFGFKFQTWENRLTGYASYFEIERINELDTHPFTGASELLDSETNEGYEIEITVAPVPRWQTRLSYYEVDVEKFYPTPRALEARTEERLALLTKYTFQEGRLDGLSLLAGVVWEGERTPPNPINLATGEFSKTGKLVDQNGNEITPEEWTIGLHAFQDVLPAEVPSSTEVKVGASYEWTWWDADWKANLVIDNLFDEKYKRQLMWSEPRNYNLTISTKF